MQNCLYFNHFERGLALSTASARSWTARATKVLMLSPARSAALETISWAESSKYPVTGCGKPFRGRRRLLRSPF